MAKEIKKTVKKVVKKASNVCPNCDGIQDASGDKCGNCNGKGTV